MKKVKAVFSIEYTKEIEPKDINMLLEWNEDGDQTALLEFFDDADKVVRALKTTFDLGGNSGF